MLCLMQKNPYMPAEYDKQNFIHAKLFKQNLSAAYRPHATMRRDFAQMLGLLFSEILQVLECDAYSIIRLLLYYWVTR